MKIIRFFREYFNKEKRCDRLGHDIKIGIVKVRMEKGSWQHCVTDYNAKQEFCKHCGNPQSKPYDLIYLQGYNKCEMPSSDWDEMREKGYLLLKRIE